MEWSNDQCLELIVLYEKNPILWDPKNKFYFSKTKKDDAWESISKQLNMDTVVARKKMSSLLGSFRAQRSKCKRSIGTGKGITEIFISKWFAFERMKFLLDRDQPNCTLDTETQEMDEGETNDSNGSSAEEENVTQSNNNVTQSINMHTEEALHTEGAINPLNGNQNLGTAEKPVHEKKSNQNKAKKPQISTVKKRKLEEDPKLTEAYKIMKETQACCSRQEKTQDRFDVYGQQIASKLRTYSKRTEIMVEHAINNILFEADLGNYDRMSSRSSFQQHSPVSTPLSCPTTSQYNNMSYSIPPASATTDSSRHSNHMDTYNDISTAQSFVATFNPINYTLEYTTGDYPTDTSQ